MTRARRFGVALATVALLGTAGDIFADPTKDQCLDANAQAQSLRRDGKLRASRDQLRICTDPGCPRLVRDDCAVRFDEIARVMPSLVFEAKDGAGSDLSAVVVTMDGQPFAAKLDGSSIDVDPGDHTFVFSVTGQPPVTRHVVVHEGDQSRHERVVLGSASPAEPSTGAAAPSEAEGTRSSGSGRRVLGFVLGGTGLAGVGIAVFFGVQTVLFNNQSQDETKKANDPTMTPQNQQTFLNAAQSDQDSAVKSQTAAIISGAAGAVALGVGAYLLLSAGHGEKTSARVFVTPSLARGGGGVSMSGTW